MDAKTRHRRNKKLTMLIGEIVRADVIAEDAARGVWFAMVGDGPGQMVIPRDFARVLEECRSMLLLATADPEIRKLASEVLEVSAAAHRQRSALAHDRWLIREDGDWRSGKTAQRRALGTAAHPRDLLDDLEPRGLSEFKSALSALRRVFWRLTALERVIVLGEPSTKADRDNRGFDLAVLRDQFDMQSKGLAIFA